jgi:hypothetical protein
MTLAVDVFVRDANGEWRVLDVPEGCDDSAGFEAWRRTVWGSEAVRSLIAATTERPRGIAERRHQLESRLWNIEAPALRALESGAGVLIW